MSPRSSSALDRDTCLSLMASQALGRLIFTHRALPDVLPVAYRLEEHGVLIRLPFGSVAAVATRDSVVAFQVDHIDVPSQIGWTVTIVGRAHELTDPDERLTSAALELSSWAGDARDLYFCVDADKVAGLRLGVVPAQGGAQVNSEYERPPYRSGGAAA